jgi:hypothetical protein
MAQNSSKLSRALKEERDALVDFTEKKLFQRISDGDTRAIIYCLSTIGRTRGWTLPKDSTLNLGDMTNNMMVVGSVIIESIPSGSHYDADGQLIGPGGLTIEHDSAGEDEAAVSDLSSVRHRQPN